MKFIITYQNDSFKRQHINISFHYENKTNKQYKRLIIEKSITLWACNIYKWQTSIYAPLISFKIM